jgi:hypothetical protein
MKPPASHKMTSHFSTTPLGEQIRYRSDRQLVMKTGMFHSNVILILLIYGFFVSAGERAFAQGESHALRRNSVYVEAFGQGMLYSINYDYRIRPEISLRAGFTNWTVPLFLLLINGQAQVTAFPLMLNYLTGGGSSHLEVGAGIMPTAISIQGSEIFLGSEIQGSTTVVVGTATLGYRLQPPEGGFVFRVGLTPLFTTKGSIMSGGLSLGYAF